MIQTALMPCHQQGVAHPCPPLQRQQRQQAQHLPKLEWAQSRFTKKLIGTQGQN